MHELPVQKVKVSTKHARCSTAREEGRGGRELALAGHVAGGCPIPEVPVGTRWGPPEPLPLGEGRLARLALQDPACTVVLQLAAVPVRPDHTLPQWDAQDPRLLGRANHLPSAAVAAGKCKALADASLPLGPGKMVLARFWRGN